MPRKQKRNGRPRGERDKTLQARMRVLQYAKKRGIISSQRACQIGKWQQAWFHLNAMVAAGQLKHAGYNQWLPARRR